RKIRDAESDRQLAGSSGVAAHVDLAAWRQIHAAQFALWHSVAAGLTGTRREAINAGGVQIGPRHILRGQRQRIVRVREPGRSLLHVLADASLEGRTLVAEEVVHHAEPWRDALPGR